MSPALSIVPTARASETRLRVAPKPLTDAELVTRAAGGDGVAFGELVRRHRMQVFSFALKLFRDRDEAEDATQDALEAVFVKPTSSIKSFAAYVCGYVRNFAMQRHTWRARRRFTDFDEAKVTSGETPSDAFEQHEARLTLRAAIETNLPPATRRVVMLLIDGASRADVAASLGTNQHMVISHMNRAMDRLAPAGTRERKPRQVLAYKGRTGTLASFAREAGLSLAGLHCRLSRGMTLEQAMETPPNQEKARAGRKCRNADEKTGADFARAR